MLLFSKELLCRTSSNGINVKILKIVRWLMYERIEMSVHGEA